MNDSKKTHCPNCGYDIDVNELLYQQLDEQARNKYQAQLSAEQARLSAQQDKLDEQSAALQATIEAQVKESLKAKAAELQTKLRAQAEQDQAERIQEMQTELADKTKKVVELNKAKSQIERLSREKDQLRSSIELEVEKKFSQELAEQSSKIQKQVADEVKFKVAEKEQVINQLKDQLSEAQRKADQGSVQIQGEVQELAIEEWLRVHFPLDSIDEIKKGVAGADTLQVVNTHAKANCGTIYYESKRTKVFSPAWIAKFKTDIQEKGADVGVLVSQVMPDGMESLGQIDGVWVCTFEEFKNLSQILRQSLIQLDQALTTQDNKGDKMGMLYDYLTGNEFRLQIEAIVEGFTQLKSDLESEKRSMQSIWKKREKQIERVLLNTNFMYSSVKGIAGDVIQNVSLLELDQDNTDN